MAEVLMLQQKDEEKILSENEKQIGSLILEHSEKEYTDVLRDSMWETFYELSPLRESLLNWYSFQKDSEILEISNGYGALTGLLGRVSRHVTVLEESHYKAECIAKRYEEESNISIVSGKISMLSHEKIYDYIIVEKAVNTKSAVKKLFADLCPFLSEKGRLLFVCENRFGMKYWCGVPDSVSGRPFGGIRESHTGEILTRHDLLEVLEHSNQINGWNVYYPYPDHKLTQAVYTDYYLPKVSVRDRVIPYYLSEQRKSLVCLENEICDGLIANNVFHIFSNSFLIECSKASLETEVVFAAISTDRGKEHGFATVITAKDTVQKRILHQEARENLILIYENQQKLEQHGICCVQQTIFENLIEMPLIKKRSLIEHLEKLYLYDCGKVDEIFDILYQNILQSSEHIPFTECKLRDSKLTEENAGKILQHAYIDMIPYNCFYIDNNLMFYDQEFVKECYPAKYVLFRALRYTYIYIQDAERIIPLQHFKDRYELNEVWNIFEKEESSFVEDNRNYDILSSFYKWAGVNKGDVDKNIDRLQDDRADWKNDNTKKSKKSGVKTLTSFVRKKFDLSIYNEDEELKRIKEVQMDMLNEFARVCEQNKLSYCAFYGTLLGTVRHRGYIPWDDDVDLAMPRKDYDKLVKIAPTVFREKYFFQTPENDAGCFYGGYGKLRNSNTTGLEEKNKGHNCNQGIWIDVFPLDNVLANETRKRKQSKEIQYYQRILMKKTYPKIRVLWDLEPKQEQKYYILGKFYSRTFLCKKLYETIVNYEGELSDKIAVLTRYQGKEEYSEYDRADFSYIIYNQFENITIPIPNGFEACLRQDYGENFLIYPEEELRHPHHRAIFDIEKSYIDYIVENK